MKTALHSVLLVLLLGCASDNPAPMKQARKQFESITPGMTREQIVQKLGQPHKRLRDGKEQWKISDQKTWQAATLSVTYAPDGKVARAEHWVDDPGPFSIRVNP